MLSLDSLLQWPKELSNFPVRGTIFITGVEEDVAAVFIKSAYKTSLGNNPIHGRVSIHI